jgi:hypothetical protein
MKWDCSIICVALLEHCRESGSLLLAPLSSTGLFEPSPQTELLESLLPIEFLLELADGLLYRLALLEFNFSHAEGVDSWRAIQSLLHRPAGGQGK